ncbi:MAG: hypothetical protein ACFE9T_06780 [Promethearchaeota archaeon]
MEEVKSILIKFLSSLKIEILNYFNQTYSYLKELISYKNIDLNKNTSNDSKKTRKNKIKNIQKAIKTGLNTIGVSMEKISNGQAKFEENSKIEEFLDYNSYVQMNFEHYVNKILLEILIEYLIDLDTKKIKVLTLFNLISEDFIQKLNQFKIANITTQRIKNIFQNQDIYNIVDFKDLSVSIGDKRLILESEVQRRDIEILKQLQIAKEDIIETLKKPKKEIIKETPLIQEAFIEDKGITQTILLDKEPRSTYLDYFGNFPSISPKIRGNFKINVVNFLNSRIVNPDFLDLENIFYYISILKMLDIEFPFNSIEILEIVKNHINGKIFSSSREAKSDPINIFFGLAIFSELNLLNKSDIIDLLAIEMFLESELKKFSPKKLSLNFYTMLSLRLMERSGTIIMNKNELLNPILNINLFNLEGYNPVSDIYYQLAVLKLIDKRINLYRFKSLYKNELKKLIKSNGSINDIITDSAKTLLIFDLLDLKEQESEFCSRLLNFITKSTQFFNLDNISKEFNWRTDKLGYKVELRMLFWAILARSQYEK